MSYCCSQCNFAAQFESGLTMHHQLHHETGVGWSSKPRHSNEKSKTMPLDLRLESASFSKENKGIKLPTRTSSATRLFDKLRARICRSKTLFAHPEEGADPIQHINDLAAQSECTSKALKDLDLVDSLREVQNETFACHLCSFDADRITVLDRHLLNDHKIGLENLLKLVMAKTKDGLTEDNPNHEYGIRQTYYKNLDEVVENGEFVIETVIPQIKILKHTSTNTDLKWTDIPDLEDNCQIISREIEKIIETPVEGNEKEHFLAKMQTLSECMNKFVNSTKTLKKVLTKEFSQKSLNRSNDRPYFDLGLGDQDSPRDWERAHSEKVERNRGRYGENRSDKVKYSAESFYF